MESTLQRRTGARRARKEAVSLPLSAEQVFRDYAPRVYSMARRMVSSEPDAEDVTQDVLLQVVRKLPTFRGDSAFPTWLYRVTVNAALSHRRKKAVREERRVRDPLDALLENDPQNGARRSELGPPEEQIAKGETQRLIDGAVAALPEAYRAVFILADVEGRPNAEVAGLLRLSLPAMKSRLHRARLLMRASLAPHFEE
jgi:RNA polymerase sigma-70 factor (ECF subfamily)